MIASYPIPAAYNAIPDTMLSTRDGLDELRLKARMHSTTMAKIIDSERR